jgi:DNA-binding NtrC family response regulator
VKGSAAQRPTTEGVGVGWEETGIQGDSPAAVELRQTLGRFARTDFSVLLQGETGVGKELCALALHRLSGRGGRFVPVNVAAIPDGLLEAELFGSLRGAFTGAAARRVGLVDSADRGTLFLDEVGDLEPRLQVKLLRFLESREVRPLGSDSFHTVDARIVTATHRNLHARMSSGGFRADLYFRVASATIRVPPLRERREDIPLLRSVFAERAVRRDGVAPCRWSASAVASLVRYHWPGNIRELRSVVEVAMVRAAGETVRPEHLPMQSAGRVPKGGWHAALDEFRRSFLADALTRHAGNRSAAARELGISRQALHYHIRNLGIS